MQFYRDVFTQVGYNLSLIYLETKVINNNKIILKFENNSYIIESDLHIKMPFRYIAISAEKIINNIPLEYHLYHYILWFYFVQFQSRHYKV